MRTALAFLILATAIGASPARADDTHIPGPLWKLTRGVVNVVTGLPAEIVEHSGGSATSDPGDTAGSYVTSMLAGALTGVGCGVLRVGSGFADVFTFPVPFDRHNRPLVRPEFAF